MTKFSFFSIICNKLSHFIHRLCYEQLSNQSHFEFGLHSIKNGLVNAGNIKRDCIQQLKQELAEQGYTLNETTLSK